MDNGSIVDSVEHFCLVLKKILLNSLAWATEFYTLHVWVPIDKLKTKLSNQFLAIWYIYKWN